MLKLMTPEEFQAIENRVRLRREREELAYEACRLAIKADQLSYSDAREAQETLARAAEVAKRALG